MKTKILLLSLLTVAGAFATEQKSLSFMTSPVKTRGASGGTWVMTSHSPSRQDKMTGIDRFKEALATTYLVPFFETKAKELTDNLNLLFNETNLDDFSEKIAEMLRGHIKSDVPITVTKEEVKTFMKLEFVNLFVESYSTTYENSVYKSILVQGTETTTAIDRLLEIVSYGEKLDKMIALFSDPKKYKKTKIIKKEIATKSESYLTNNNPLDLFYNHVMSLLLDDEEFMTGVVSPKVDFVRREDKIKKLLQDEMIASDEEESVDDHPEEAKKAALAPTARKKDDDEALDKMKGPLEAIRDGK